MRNGVVQNDNRNSEELDGHGDHGGSKRQNGKSGWRYMLKDDVDREMLLEGKITAVQLINSGYVKRVATIIKDVEEDRDDEENDSPNE